MKNQEQFIWKSFIENNSNYLTQSSQLYQVYLTFPPTYLSCALQKGSLHSGCLGVFGDNSG